MEATQGLYPQRAHVRLRELSPQDEQRERNYKIGIIAISVLLLAVAAIGYYLVLRHKPDEAIKFKTSIIVPIMSTLAAIASAAIVPFIDLEKSKWGSIAAIQTDKTLREAVIHELLEGDIEGVYDLLYMKRNGGLRADQEVGILGEMRETAKEILQSWRQEVAGHDPETIDLGRKEEIRNQWKTLQSRLMAKQAQNLPQSDVAVGGDLVEPRAESNVAIVVSEDLVTLADDVRAKVEEEPVEGAITEGNLIELDGESDGVESRAESDVAVMGREDLKPLAEEASSQGEEEPLPGAITEGNLEEFNGESDGLESRAESDGAL